MLDEIKAKLEADDRALTIRMYKYLALGIFGVVSAILFKFLTSTVDLPEAVSYPPFQGKFWAICQHIWTRRTLTRTCCIYLVRKEYCSNTHNTTMSPE